MATTKLAQHKQAKEMLSICVSNNMKDSDIVNYLEKHIGIRWNIETIRRARKSLGLLKNAGGTTTKSTSPQIHTTPPADLEANEKAEWFREGFRKGHLYATLANQFSDAEVAIYMEEYGNICCQFEDILTSEFFQIDDFLKHRILINRQLTVIKKLQVDMGEVNKWVSEHPVTELNKEDKTFMRSRADAFKKMEFITAQIKDESDRYDKLAAERGKIYSALNATRRDRVEQLKVAGDNFFAIVAAIAQNDALRKQEGKFAELTKMAADDVKADWRKSTKFPDGQNDAVLLDEHTEFDAIDEEDEKDRNSRGQPTTEAPTETQPNEETEDEEEEQAGEFDDLGAVE